jgi:hypothetical protein
MVSIYLEVVFENFLLFVVDMVFNLVVDCNVVF